MAFFCRKMLKDNKMTKTGKKKFEKKEDLKKDNIVVQKAMTLSILVSVKFCILSCT